ncbi:MAG: transcription termination factor NusA [Alphaproteobacteria bacterium]|nr:transcription termination factor NusA [Alphaproteobacteria bacterium]
MDNPAGMNNNELIQIAENVAREKGVARDIIMDALEQAIQVASKKKYGHDNVISAKISQKTGEISLTREMQVVESVENSHTEIDLSNAKHKNPDVKVGDVIHEPLPPLDLARVFAQSAKQVIVQKVREAEREKQYEEFKDRVAEIINGVVKRVEFGNVIIDLGRGEAVLRRENLIPGENFRINDRVKSYIEEVKRDNKGHQIILSRTHPNFVRSLFEQEVPEIYDKIIEIKNVAREPGSKSKVAVFTSDNSIDPVGSCVGVRGSRIQAIINELQGEKIDVIKWSSDPAQYVINSLAPAEVAKVIIDEDKRKIEVVVPTEHLSMAIGRRGQNVRLASNLLGWNIDILVEEEESKRRVEEFNATSELFIKELGVEEVLAQLLSAEGFANLEDIAYVSVEELGSIEGLDEGIAKELIERAQKSVKDKNQSILEELSKLGVDKDVMELFGTLPPEQMLVLANAGVKEHEDLADLSVEEFKRILPNSNMEDENIRVIIEKAKEKSESGD